MPEISSPAQLESLRKKLQGKYESPQKIVAVCGGTGCKAQRSFSLADAFRKQIRSKRLGKKVELRLTGCHGFCERGPLVLVHPEGILYQRVKESDAAEILDQTVRKGKVIERLLYRDPQTDTPIAREADIPFYKHQKRLVLADNGQLDPTSIDEYIARGGYAALARAIEKGAEWVLRQVEASGLRGRG
ncbi:MAG: NADH-quinone oxidoreductase subunit F, partial [Deltaproteobacteria bacterium]